VSSARTSQLSTFSYGATLRAVVCARLTSIALGTKSSDHRRSGRSRTRVEAVYGPRLNGAHVGVVRGVLAAIRANHADARELVVRYSL